MAQHIFLKLLQNTKFISRTSGIWMKKAISFVDLVIIHHQYFPYQQVYCVKHGTNEAKTMQGWLYRVNQWIYYLKYYKHKFTVIRTCSAAIFLGKKMRKPYASSDFIGAKCLMCGTPREQSFNLNVVAAGHSCAGLCTQGMWSGLDLPGLHLCLSFVLHIS